MSTKSSLPIGRLLTGALLLALAFLSPARQLNPLLAWVAAAWGALFWISAALYRTEFGHLLATARRDERQSRLDTIGSQLAFLVVVILSVMIVALRPAWSSSITAALVMSAGLLAYMGGLAYGAARK